MKKSGLEEFRWAFMDWMYPIKDVSVTVLALTLTYNLLTTGKIF